MIYETYIYIKTNKCLRLRGIEKKLGEEFSDSLHHKLAEVAPSRHIIQTTLHIGCWYILQI